MKFRLEPVRVATGSSDEQAVLVFVEGDRLVAVLTHLGECHGELGGQ